jgi:hypothetical protein
MSDIPKSERSESRLEAQHKAYKIRKMITAELMASFAYSKKKHEKHIQAMTEHIKNEEEKKDTAQKEELLEGIRRIAEEYGLIINEKKTRIVRLDSFFRHLQIGYSLQKSGRLIRKINPKAITRERRKLKAYKRKLDKDEMPYGDIENAFKGWMGGNYKRMSRKQITNMFVLYYQLFERRPTWKKRHGRLRWLMVQSLKTFS